MLIAPFVVGATATTAPPSAGPASSGPDLLAPWTDEQSTAPAEATVDLAEQLLAADAGARTPLAGALAQARQASTWQAEELDATAEAPSVAPHDRPSQAALALLDRHNLRLTADERANVRALDDLPADVATELANVLDAFLALETATQQAFADLDAIPADAYALAPRLDASAPAEDEGASPGERLDELGIDLGPVFAARNGLLAEIDALDRALDRTPALAAGSGPVVHQPPALVIDADGQDNAYTEDAAWQLDLGGADTYHNNAGGSGLTNPPVDAASENPCDVPMDQAVSLHTAAGLVDLGEADDAYGDPAGPGSCGRVGGSNFGSGLLVDDGGNDTYRAGNDARVADCTLCGVGSFGAVGAGNFGSALLVDAAGDDTYEVGTGSVTENCAGGSCHIASFAVLGAGDRGAGLLVDGGGDDTYDAGTGSTVLSCGGADCGMGSASTTGGGQVGVGTLLDDGDGEDLYRVGSNTENTCTGGACGSGAVAVNGGAGVAGVGLLADGGGDDTYDVGTGTTFLACGAFNCGIGAIGVNGGGQSGSGALVDAGGDDTYQAGVNSEVAACGGGSCGVGAGGVNGGAVAGGTAVLADHAGDDTYQAGTGSTIGFCPSQGCNLGGPGANGGAMGGQGLLLDGGGSDDYEDEQGGTGTDRTVVPKGPAGAQIDSDDGPAP